MKIKNKIAMLIGLLNKIYYFPKRSRISIGKNFLSNHLIQITGTGKVTIGDNCNFVSHSQKLQIHTYSSHAKVTISDNCRLNGSILQSQSSIHIGSFVLAGSCHIIDTDFHSLDHQDRKQDISLGIKQNVNSKPIQIDNDVWIGGEVIILKGVHLQKGCVVGIRSVVTKSFPQMAVIAGNPAKQVKTTT